MLQIIRKSRAVAGALSLPGVRMRRLTFLVLIAATTAYGVSMMFDILSANGMSPLEMTILVLFAITFGWIVIAFWTAVAGFVLQFLGRDPLSLRRSFRRANPDAPITTRTAIIMPAYNEETERVFAGFEAIYLDLLATGEADHFHFHFLSDTTDPDIAAAEEVAWQRLERLNTTRQLFYRRRTANIGRKVGNIAEFCRRCGHLYDYMVVLDADSLMSGKTLADLVRVMQANPRAGIIQTMPLPVRQETMFGRFLQFAAALYGPMLASGMSFWQMDAANYWGHNAIIRMRPFMEHCELPVLSGKPPLGGEILSHDFVESALMRRAGWHVYALPELTGSYEEAPSNVLDYAKRDRRWAEGNIQHLRLLGLPGLHLMSRAHFVMGAFAYLCSFLWLIMLAAGTADAVSRAVSDYHFFEANHQMFPNWPIMKTSEMVSLLYFVIFILFSPKLMGVITTLTWRERRRGFGGIGPLLLSVMLDTIFAVLIAPVMMTFHAYIVANVLLGRRAIWGPQNRHGRFVPYREAFASTYIVILIASAWAALTAYLSPIYFWALSPVLIGLLLAAPLISLSSSLALGRWLRGAKIFLTPMETAPPTILNRLEVLEPTVPTSSPDAVKEYGIGAPSH